ncbi:sugar transferase [Mariniblastus fucicola]|uniref:UDP-N-acetylgalactosamine-undecaprenyl-phosphate N-acetylgalactosaminephosphotransferase n=1 Tax=Mariniblastus fucicola TaxID=980251 RepID=A0A5B9PBF8_9BACT|nr:sugar transferase [Mariniblastus fucicola]QEG22330.1 UDP-N-acetylgalactosamine-undecaprenyl-phosphate N-acetylgalactosaminephosphotransferase [Mariniblastus fucicola]
MIKRLFDIVLSLTGIIVLSPVMLVCALLVKLTSKGPVFFEQIRVGKNFQPFGILKFRSMVVDAEKLGAQITADRDPRITSIGRILRKTKLDELPQLINVLKGDMSLVGPRPEVPKYVELFEEDFRKLLQVRPGITDIASIEYRFEEEILAQSSDPTQTYIEEILPAKIKLGEQYVNKSSVLFDVQLIFKTFLTIVGSDRKPPKSTAGEPMNKASS